jgi:hypothetical protein
MQRWVWDMRYAPPAGFPRSFPISAIYRNTPSQPLGPRALPGEYTVKLTVGGKTYAQPLIIKMDPRVTTPPEGIAKMNEISLRSYEGISKVRAAQAEIRQLREQLKAAKEKAGQSPVAETIAALDQKAAAMEGAPGGFGPRGGGGTGLARLAGDLLTVMNLVEGADAMPTSQAVAASEQLQKSLSETLSRWGEIKDKDVKSLNAQLRQANLPAIGN